MTTPIIYKKLLRKDDLWIESWNKKERAAFSLNIVKNTTIYVNPNLTATIRNRTAKTSYIFHVQKCWRFQFLSRNKEK